HQRAAAREARRQVRSLAARMKTALIHSEDWARFDYGPQHPLRMERLGLTWRLMQAYGLTNLPGATVLTPSPADERQIGVYHAPEYLAVLQAANSGAPPPRGSIFGLGAGDNPVFPGLWEAARLVGARAPLGGRLRGRASWGPARSWRPIWWRAARPIAPSTSPAACTMRCPGARPASAT